MLLGIYEVGYEARIDGVEDDEGVSDLAAFSVDSLSALESVLADLRYEWRCILGEHSTSQDVQLPVDVAV